MNFAPTHQKTKDSSHKLVGGNRNGKIVHTHTITAVLSQKEELFDQTGNRKFRFTGCLWSCLVRGRASTDEKFHFRFVVSFLFFVFAIDERDQTKLDELYDTWIHSDKTTSEEVRCEEE